MHRQNAFTLIELLVVISIIALLIGILLPALSAARDTALAISCQSNVRQIGYTVYMYADDFDQYLPAGDLERRRNHVPQWMMSRLESSEVFHCPADELFDADSYALKTSYGYNNYYLARVVTWGPPRKVELHKMDEGTNPSSTIVFGDSGHQDEDGWASYEIRFTKPTMYLYGRHHQEEKASILWLDGHCTTESPETFHEQSLDVGNRYWRLAKISSLN
ncbi:type II secretion system protein [Planctomycetota bacterium]|nr:type II secretion system protein [Planctomycetota bacterium]